MIRLTQIPTTHAGPVEVMILGCDECPERMSRRYTRDARRQILEAARERGWLVSGARHVCRTCARAKGQMSLLEER
jgi:hypothetical protein